MIRAGGGATLGARSAPGWHYPFTLNSSFDQRTS